MELLLEVRTDAGGFDGRAFAVSVQLDAADTVTDLVSALLAYVRRQGVAVAGVDHGLVVLDHGHALADGAAVASSGLRSGHTVKLVPAAGSSRPPRSATPPVDHTGQIAHNRAPYRRVVVGEAALQPLAARPRPRPTASSAWSQRSFP